MRLSRIYYLIVQILKNKYYIYLLLSCQITSGKKSIVKNLFTHSYFFFKNILNQEQNIDTVGPENIWSFFLLMSSMYYCVQPKVINLGYNLKIQQLLKWVGNGIRHKVNKVKNKWRILEQVRSPDIICLVLITDRYWKFCCL